MRRRVFSLGTVTLLAVLAWWLTVPAAAQQLTTISISEPQGDGSRGDVSDLLRHGQQLEQERHWSDALSHYEDALRKHPADAALQQRFGYARLHYDLQRRYNDRSFGDAVARLSFERALELYSQVLLKIDSYYVEAPKWKDLADRGRENLEVALSEPTFLERNVAETARPALGAFRRELRDMTALQPVNSRTDARGVVVQAARLAQQRLGMSPTAVVFEYLCGATNALDVYSTYLTPDQLNEVYAQIDGSFVGLGVELKAAEGGLSIVRVIAGSPAEQVGIRAGDQILVVDGRSTQGLTTDQAATLLQGADGTLAAMTVASPGQPPRQLTMRRRHVDVPSIEQARIIDREHGVGYFKLTCFQKTTARDLDAALWRLHHEGMRSLVVDVRGNPGGLLDAAVDVVDRFVDRGVIVSTHGRSPQENRTYTAHEQGKWRMPLVVMIDQDSASAAEIFAGAIRDHGRGQIVGVRSFGKGSSQGIFPLDDTNSGVRLTTSKLYLPSNRPYSGVGIEPNIVVEKHVVARPINGQISISGVDDDPMLDRAVQAAAAGAANPISQTSQASQTLPR